MCNNYERILNEWMTKKCVIKSHWICWFYTRHTHESIPFLQSSVTQSLKTWLLLNVITRKRNMCQQENEKQMNHKTIDYVILLSYFCYNSCVNSFSHSILIFVKHFLLLLSFHLSFKSKARQNKNLRNDTHLELAFLLNCIQFPIECLPGNDLQAWGLPSCVSDMNMRHF